MFVRSKNTPISARIAEDKFFDRTRWHVLVREPGRDEWKAGVAENLPSAIILAQAAIHHVAAGKVWYSPDWDDE